MKKGFTLVELSIVLVIIGLLVGGILIGQSLIDSVRIQSQIRQIQQFDVAFYGFKDKFKQLPGDNILLTPVGDNDGVIENDKTAGVSSSFLLEPKATEEKANFWKHLSDSQMLSKAYTNTDLTGPPYVYQPDGNAPKAAIRNNTIVIIGYTDSRLFWILRSANSSNGAGGVPVAAAAAIDQKLDDGKGYGYSDAPKTVYSPVTSCTGSGGADSGPYKIDIPQDCVLAIEIGLSANR